MVIHQVSVVLRAYYGRVRQKLRHWTPPFTTGCFAWTCGFLKIGTALFTIAFNLLKMMTLVSPYQDVWILIGWQKLGFTMITVVLWILIWAIFWKTTMKIVWPLVPSVIRAGTLGYWWKLLVMSSKWLPLPTDPLPAGATLEEWVYHPTNIDTENHYVFKECILPILYFAGSMLAGRAILICFAVNGDTVTWPAEITWNQRKHAGYLKLASLKSATTPWEILGQAQ